jgi:16S rRNA (uracil1498-N3)-methyltransferase
MRRFFSPQENFKDGKVTLTEEETRHLKNVLRLSAGQEISVFDGHGKEFLCRIREIEKRRTFLEVLKEIPKVEFESPLGLTLAVSLLKGDKFDLVIQKAVELGVTGFIPLITKRCDVKFRNEAKKLERWRKIIIEASKQCGRARLMEMGGAVHFEKFVKEAGGVKLLFAESKGKDFSSIRPGQKITAAIGPEGGWDDPEIELAGQNGFQIITFGGRILRAETAVISITTILQHRFGDLH